MTGAWQQRFDRLLKAMASGEPHKARERAGPHAPPDNATPRASEEGEADIEAQPDRER